MSAMKNGVTLPRAGRLVGGGTGRESFQSAHRQCH
jgi:hypothetical protein